MTCSMVDYIIAAEKVPPQQDEWHLFGRKDDWLSKTERDFDFSSVESTEIPLNNVADKMQSLIIFAPQMFFVKISPSDCDFI